MGTTRSAPATRRGATASRLAASVLAVALVLSACASGDDTTDETSGLTTAATATTDGPSAGTTVPGPTVAPTSTSAIVADSSTSVAATSSPTTMEPTTTAPPTTSNDAWTAEVTATCTEFRELMYALPSSDGTAEGVAAVFDRVAAFDPSGLPLDAIDYPDDVRPDTDQALALLQESDVVFGDAIELAAAGDAAAAEHAGLVSFDLYRRATGYLALAGAECFEAEPARMAAADLTVHTELDTSQVVAAFGSIWFSQVLGNHLVRIDPNDGTTLATVAVGDTPLKAQPADGLLWVRSAGQYDAIDPETNTVVRTLAKADVGPEANRSWATDGALWICDGRQLHRYDTSTLQLVETVELEFDCGQVTVGDGLVIAWSYNEDDGESGSSAAAIIDGSTNEALATVVLPVDVGVPVVLDEAIFFPGMHGAVSVVVQRSDWTIGSTHDLGRATAGSLAVTDGSQIYIPQAGEFDVLVVDAGTYDVVDTIETQGANGLALLDGSLWTAAAYAGVAQRFDL